jgi:NADH:ubiquinone oxidoreductase subunit F (NADH-binding)
MAEIGARFTDGRARPQDAALATDLAHDISASALCDHERLATLPLLSGMRYFASELDEHIHRSTCPAGVCSPIGLAGAAPRTT